MADFNEIVKLCTVLSSYYPHAPEMEGPHFHAYHQMLSEFEPEIIKAAMLECVAGSPNFIPPAPKIRQQVFELLAQASGRPTAEEAWAEVNRSFSTHGRYAGPPEWSHTLIGNAIASMGGYADLCASENAVADRAHFYRIYAALIERDDQQQRMLPESRKVLARLTEGEQQRRLQAGETIADLAKKMRPPGGNDRDV
jgi:hypothetical protein